MQLVTVISNEVDALFQRIIKFRRFGKSDVQTSPQVAPYGTDSNPIKDMIAVYSATSEKGETVIIGYLNKNQLADIGEHRTFSTDEDGNVQFFVWLKNDGTLQLGGDSKHLARFEELKSGFDQLKDDLNDMKNKWNAFTLAYVQGGPSSVGTPPTLAGQDSQVSTASIDDSKIDEIKTL